jgi:hypothetical protein
MGKDIDPLDFDRLRVYIDARLSTMLAEKLANDPEAQAEEREIEQRILYGTPGGRKPDGVIYVKVQRVL